MRNQEENQSSALEHIPAVVIAEEEEDITGNSNYAGFVFVHWRWKEKSRVLQKQAGKTTDKNKEKGRQSAKRRAQSDKNVKNLLNAMRHALCAMRERSELKMTMTDPIADMLTRIRNANKAEKEYVDIPPSKVKVEIARVLKEQGYIDTYKVVGDQEKNILRIYLKYAAQGEKVISMIKRVSRGGCRIYSSKDEIPVVLGGMGISIISTSKGIMTGTSAKKMGIGGEVLCQVW